MEIKSRPAKIKRRSFCLIIGHLSLSDYYRLGVYIRAIARDLGEKLGTGAYLSALKRTRVGKYTESDVES